MLSAPAFPPFLPSATAAGFSCSSGAGCGLSHCIIDPAASQAGSVSGLYRCEHWFALIDDMDCEQLQRFVTGYLKCTVRNVTNIHRRCTRCQRELLPVW